MSTTKRAGTAMAATLVAATALIAVPGAAEAKAPTPAQILPKRDGLGLAPLVKTKNDCTIAKSCPSVEFADPTYACGDGPGSPDGWFAQIARFKNAKVAKKTVNRLFDLYLPDEVPEGQEQQFVPISSSNVQSGAVQTAVVEERVVGCEGSEYRYVLVRKGSRVALSIASTLHIAAVSADAQVQRTRAALAKNWKRVPVSTPSI